MAGENGGQAEVFDISESAFTYLSRNASASAVDTVRVGDYLVCSSDVSSQEAAQMLLDCRVRAGLADALAGVAELEASYRAQSGDADMAFEVWHIVEDASTQRLEIIADYAEVEGGRVEYRSGRFQDLAPARAYVKEKWQLFVERFDEQMQAASRMESFASYQNAFSVRVVLERTFPLG